MKHKIFGLLAVGLLAGPMGANAAIITYDFTTTVGDGYFSYDDTNTTVLPNPPWVHPSAVTYAATAYVFAGVDYGSSGAICVLDNFLGAFDGLVVGNVPDFFGQPLLSLQSTNIDTLSGSALADLNDLTLSDWDFASTAFNSSGVSGTVTSLVRRAVPEPATVALLGLGLAGLGLTRRRKAN